MLKEFKRREKHRRSKGGLTKQGWPTNIWLMLKKGQNNNGNLEWEWIRTEMKEWWREIQERSANTGRGRRLKRVRKHYDGKVVDERGLAQREQLAQQVMDGWHFKRKRLAAVKVLPLRAAGGRGDFPKTLTVKIELEILEPLGRRMANCIHWTAL